MNNFRFVIDRLERALLRWARTIVTVTLYVLLLGGMVTLLGSLSGFLASADVSLGDDIDRVAFKEPDLSSLTANPTSAGQVRDNFLPAFQAGRSPQRWSPDSQYDDEVSDIVEAMRPLADALQFNVSGTGLRNYAISRVNSLDSAIGYAMQSVDDEVAKDHLDDAVYGMVEYAEDLADFYGDEVDLDRSRERAEAEITPEFRQYLVRVMNDPLAPYVHEVRQAVAALTSTATYEAQRVSAARAEARESLITLVPIALCLLGGVLLLLIFRVELSLRRQADALSDASSSTGLPEASPAAAD